MWLQKARLPPKPVALLCSWFMLLTRDNEISEAVSSPLHLPSPDK